MAVPTRSATRSTRPAPAGRATTILAWILAAGSVAFAIVNVAFEINGRFDEGPLAEYASALSIVNWFVAIVKLLGAAVAVLSVARRPRLAPRTVNTLVWGATGVLGIYSLGSLGQAIGIVMGGSPDQIDLAGVLYVLFFLAAAAGFMALATSHSRRARVGAAPVFAGLVGGLLLLGVILLVLPWALSALGVMP